ncbi:succinylglutamate desuccinylase [Nocardioides sp. Root190]|uniref:succinylglutamate desuccinylase/aspartoacylase family protein n=1 Tax=Nocardioides sp. Root190 TaxID=1736488 RepID=UPI0006FE672F|nr:succinylglutamate desuccinylase/aspartoacylase family protein [Nocardioides sp. Root190]KRB76273.1 succinylglutamate desuccinylase [Nocardioides sp. Root190]
MARESFAIGNVRVRAGSTKEVELPITRLVTGGDVSLPVRVVHGREPGPTVWVNAAIHGDEVMGVEVIRQAVATLSPRTLRGTLLAVPVVNVLGFMTGDRYLPDRRDLNRSFPGSARGSLASRIAHLFMTEVVSKCEVGIDLHTAADRRTNLPQIRADLDDPRTRELAEAFGAPVMLHARLRDGSLRQAGRDRGATVLLYEAGEALRFEEEPIAVGVQGVRRVLAALDMIDPLPPAPEGETPPAEARTSGWVRARGTGILHLEVHLGDRVEEGQRLGGLSDTFGRRVRLVHADRPGIVIGLTRAPLVNAGDALIHIATPV